MAKRRTQECMAGKDGAKENSPFPGQLEGWVFHLYPVPGDRVNNSWHLGSPHQHTQSSLSICGGKAPAQMRQDRTPKPPGSVGTSLGFGHLRFSAIVCLVSICKQSDHTVLTHLAALRMMKNLGVKSHVSLVERNFFLWSWLEFQTSVFCICRA